MRRLCKDRLSDFLVGFLMGMLLQQSWEVRKEIRLRFSGDDIRRVVTESTTLASTKLHMALKCVPVYEQRSPYALHPTA